MINEEIIKKIKSGARVRVYSTGGGSPPKACSKGASASGGDGHRAHASHGEGTTHFEGLVIARKHGNEPGATFTVRAIVAGVGVEKIFPLHSPNITKVVILSSPKKVHRSKLYFVRKMSGARIRQKLGVSV
jgi:large subunit ribosomal protein L19